MTSFIPKHILIHLSKRKGAKHKGNPSIHLTYENPIIHLKQGSNLHMVAKHIIIARKTSYKFPNIHLIIFHHKVKP